MQATAGISTSRASRIGREYAVGVSLIDQGTGQWAAIGVLSALLERGGTVWPRRSTSRSSRPRSATSPYQLIGYLADGTSRP